MRISISVVNGPRIDLNIEVSEMMYGGNEVAKGKCIWMGEAEHRMCVNIGISKDELDTLNKVYMDGELGQITKVGERIRNP